MATQTKGAILITDAAAERIKKLIADFAAQNNLPENPNAGLRLAVKGGGCSGLSYTVKIEVQKRPGDKVFENNGAKVYIDLKSFIYLAGTVLDYEESLRRSGFVFRNPNVKRTCGCGESFTV